VASTIVTFAIGDDGFLHRQANFAAVAILAHAPQSTTLVVATDRPHYYRWLGRYLTVLELDERILKDWKGAYGYFWRIKVRLMQTIREAAPGHLIYVDSDVACRAPLAPFIALLDGGAAFMHETEYAMHKKGGRGGRLWKRTVGKRFGRFTVDRTSRMWNAGVIALPAPLAETRIAEALECLDAMCADGIESTLLEQFSLSLSLDRDGQLHEAKDWFIHYWGNKTAWNALIARFLAEACIQCLSPAEVFAHYRGLSLNLPPMIKRTRVERLTRSLHKRLARRDNSIVAQLNTQLLG
jgi:hypothetical protein